MSLKLYRRKGSKIWCFRGTVGPDGKRERLRGSTRTEDKAIAAREIIEIERRFWKGHHDGPEEVLTFREAANLHRAAGKSDRFLSAIEDYFGDTLVKDITPGAIRQMALELYGHCTGASRNRLAIVPARAAINTAAADGLCSPVRVKLFEVETAEKDFATLEWIQAFRKEATPQVGGFALFMFLTGARPSEALEADIDLTNASARIRASKVGHEREVHLPEMLVAALANIPRVEGRSLFFYGSRDAFYPPWYAAIESAKIKEMSPHCCRHGFITGLLRKGVDVKTIEWLADVTAETLLRTYAHAIKDRRLTNVLTGTNLTQVLIENERNPRKMGTT